VCEIISGYNDTTNKQPWIDAQLTYANFCVVSWDVDPWSRSHWPGFWHAIRFINRSVHARLQVCMQWFVPPWL